LHFSLAFCNSCYYIHCAYENNTKREGRDKGREGWGKWKERERKEMKVEMKNLLFLEMNVLFLFFPHCPF
jgi:hypothetical protein